MTIVEELDKKSGNPHRSKNIVEAQKYAYGLEHTPKNIADGIKQSLIYQIWHLGVGLAPAPTEEQGVDNNNKVKSVEFKDNTATVTVKLSDLTAFASSDPDQGTHKWLALEVKTGITPLTNVKYGNSALTAQDIADAKATGCSADAFVLYIRAEEVAVTDKTFTLKTNGNDDVTVTIKVVEPEA